MQCKGERIPSFGTIRVVAPSMLLYGALFLFFNFVVITDMAMATPSALGAERRATAIVEAKAEDSHAWILPIAVLLALAATFVYERPVATAVGALRKGEAVDPAVLEIAKRRLPKTAIVAALTAPTLALLFAILDYAKAIGSFGFPQATSLFAVDAVALSLSALFVFLWQKHRIQRYYLRALFTKEELSRSLPGWRRYSIKRNMIVMIAASSFLPLAVIAFFLVSGVSFLNGRDDLSDDQIDAVFGRDRLAGFEDGLASEVLSPGDHVAGTGKGLLSGAREGAWPLPYYTVIDTLRIAFGLALSLSVVLLYVFFIVRWNISDFICPLDDLRSGMDRLKAGELGVQVGATTTNEIGELTVDFNAMARGLEERDKIKGLFGRYLATEVYDAIIDGRVNLSGARYDVTVMFTDIRDFTALSSRMSPERVFAFLNEYLEEMIESIAQSGGIIDKFLGDGILAVFGLPVPRQDHAEQAVRAALDMRDRLAKLNAARAGRGEERIEIGAGLHSGEVIAGNVGNERKMQFTVIGDTVNLASRIEALNKELRTKILVSGETWSRLTEALRASLPEAARLPPTRLRGAAADSELWSLG
jgi:class 3 adenylate cyclase